MRLLTETTAIKMSRYGALTCADCGSQVSKSQPECDLCGSRFAVVDDPENEYEYEYIESRRFERMR